MDVLWIVLSGVAGLAIGSGCMVGLSKAGLNKNQQKAEQILKEAQNEAESRVKQAVLDGKTQAHDLRVEAEKEIKEIPKQSDLERDQLALILALKVIRSYDDEFKNLQELLDKMENEIFLKNTSDTNQIRRLYRLKRKSGLNTRLLNLSGDWVNAFKTLNLKEVEVADLIDKQKDVIADFDHLNAQVTNLISMYLALTDQKANQVMKVLAIYSMYFFPITFIAGIYGMNFENMPELKEKNAYFITLGVMAFIALLTFLYVRRKRW